MVPLVKSSSFKHWKASLSLCTLLPGCIILLLWGYWKPQINRLQSVNYVWSQQKIWGPFSSKLKYVLPINRGFSQWNVWKRGMSNVWERLTELPRASPKSWSRIHAEEGYSFMSASLMSIERTADVARALCGEKGQGSHPVLGASLHPTLNEHCPPAWLRCPLTKPLHPLHEKPCIVFINC